MFVLAVHSGTLSAPRAFTTLSIIEIITTPLGLLLQALPSVTSSLACLDRIQTYLKSPDRIDPRAADEMQDGSMSTEKARISSHGSVLPEAAISFQDAKITHNAAEGDIFVLPFVSLDVPYGSITMIVGPVGGGKSLLLKAVLGEVDVRGELYVRPRPIAYCEQSPWIPNGSARECILGMSGADFDSAWFDEVVYACAIGEDRDLYDLVYDSDAKAVGSRGMALSEGQKQKLVRMRSWLPLCIPPDFG